MTLYSRGITSPRIQTHLEHDLSSGASIHVMRKEARQETSRLCRRRYRLRRTLEPDNRCIARHLRTRILCQTVQVRARCRLAEVRAHCQNGLGLFGSGRWVCYLCRF